MVPANMHSLFMLHCVMCGCLFGHPANASSLLQVSRESASTTPSIDPPVPWNAGKSAWQAALQATTREEATLWEEENVCDPAAAAGSASLTVLFGISNFWASIRKQREAKRISGPLEVHVIGASYPFEGRADWSLLASRRPADVSGVRIVLVLGTPWQGDNLPTLKHTSLLQSDGDIAKKRHPIGGRWTDSGVKCAESKAIKEFDASVTKENLCRDHGNGLEVVCLEKFYQDTDLQTPDLAVMFSPGFPQLSRRSWDTVLQDLLDKNVLIMVNDEVSGNSLNSIFLAEDSKLVPAGEDLPTVAGHRRGEDSDTLKAMRAYGSKLLAARRNPFPILIREGNELIAKNSVMQVFQGRVDGAMRVSLPQAERRAADLAAINKFDWSNQQDGNELKKSLLIPVSSAYEEACREVLLPSIRDVIEKKGHKSLNEKEKHILRKLGLVGRDNKSKPKAWGPQVWLFLMKHFHLET